MILPVLAAAGQAASQVLEDKRGEEAVRLIPHSVAAVLIGAAALLVAAWLLSTLGAIVTFGGFTVTRDGDRLRIRRGLVSRNEATVPVGRVRAVRVVEGLLRRPFGLASLTVEVTGYAEEASAARTLFPLVRVRDVPAFLAEFLPELADDVAGLERPPARAARRYVLVPALVGAAVAVAAWFAVGPVRAARAADRRVRVRAVALGGLAVAGRPAGGALAGDRTDDGARAGAVPGVAHAVPERVPAARAAGGFERGVREGHDGADPAPGRGRGAVGVGRAVAPANCPIRE